MLATIGAASLMIRSGPFNASKPRSNDDMLDGLAL
jgi:hypothetical protein